MGRKKKYKTKEEKNEGNRNKSKSYYMRNRETICKKRMQKYWNQLEKKLPNVQ